MKKMLPSALILLAGTTGALAAPRESVTFTNVTSNGLLNEAPNVVLNTTFAGSDGGGAYSARYLTINGSSTRLATGHSHNGSAIMITPPGGQPFIARPSSSTSTTAGPTIATDAGAYVIPVSAFTTAGEWSFRFFELSDQLRTTSGTAPNNLPDATWDSITFTLDDSAPPTGANPGPGQNFSFTFVDVDGTSTAPMTFTFSAAPGDLVPIVRFSAAGTARSASSTTNTTTNPLTNTRIQIVTPDGSITTAAATMFSGTTTVLSSATGSATASLATPADSGGVWTVRVYPTVNNTGVDSTLTNLTVSFLQPDPPASTPVTLSDGNFVTQSTTISPGQVIWYRIDVPTQIINTSFNALDIDNEGSSLSNAGTGTTSPQDTAMALFNAFGTSLVTDSADGSDLLAQLSFGRGTRPAEQGSGTSASVAYNGRDGALAAGTYYLAVTTGTATTTPGFGVTGTNSATIQISGSLNTRFRYLSNTGNQPPASTQMSLTEGVWNTATAPLTSGGVAWFSFDLPAMTSTGALEIDTVGSSLTPSNDTSMAMFSFATGALGDTDNNDGPGFLSEFAYGSTTTSNGRQSPSGLRYDGRDGSATSFATNVVPGGRFYIAVVGGDTITGDFATDFVAPTNGVNSGTAGLRVRYWTTAAPTGTPDEIATELTVPTDGTWVSATKPIDGPNDIAWFKFTAPASLTATGALDIDTEGTSLGPVNDTDIGLYRDQGTLVDSDDNDHTDDLSALSYGGGYRLAPGNGLPYNGRDGTIVAGSTTGISPGGVYYVAVGASTNVSHASTFDASSSSTTVFNIGTVTLRVRAWDADAPFQLPSTNIDLPGAGVWHTATGNIANVGEVSWFNFTVPSTVTATGAVDIDTEGTSLTALNDTDIGLYAATGTLVDSDDNDGSGSLSLLSYGTGSRLGTGDGVRYRGQDGAIGGTGAVAAGQQYYLAVAGGTNATHASPFNTSAGGLNSGPVTVRVRYFESNAPTDPATVPTAESLTLVNNGTVSDTEVLAIGATKWYSFNLPMEISATMNRALHIDTETSATTPTVDSAIGLYRADGTLRASDTGDGTGNLGTLSFGIDDLPAPGDGLALNGRDGALTAGLYYLAVLPGAGTFNAAAFEVLNTSATQEGTVTTNIQMYDPAATPATEPPAGAIDVGVVGSPTTPAETVITRTFNVTDGNTAQWFRFETRNAATPDNNFYLDIDTENTDVGGTLVSGNLSDTEIGVYTSQGFFVAEDGEDGTGFRSRLTFGETSPARTIPPTPTSSGTESAPRLGDGIDGPLPAGVYYLSVSTFSTTFNATNFSLTLPTTRAGTVGDRTVNWRTNLPASLQCGPSDVAGSGQTVGSDGQLTADDIIVFIGWFFAADARADVAGSGQVPVPDTQFTADDIIVFISRFFAGC